jgi:hypothetical protein
VRRLSSTRSWFRFWYEPAGGVKVWGPTRLYYELGFVIDETITIEIALECDSNQMARLGIHGFDAELLKNSPLIPEKGFVLEELSGGWLCLKKTMDDVHVSTGMGISDLAIERTAQMLKELILGTHGLFQPAVPAQKAEGTLPDKPVKRESEKSPLMRCRTCGGKLEKVNLKEGGSGWQCADCQKIFKPKAVPQEVSG